MDGCKRKKAWSLRGQVADELDEILNIETRPRRDL
jgi:hypothetical protein